MPEQLFAIYSRRDLNRVRALRRLLRGAGFDLWIDLDSLRPGTAWAPLLADALSSSAAAVLIHSWEWTYDPHFLSTELPFLLRVARTAGNFPPVAGVRADDASVPAPLRTLAWAGWYDEPSAAPLLTSAIRNVIDGGGSGAAAFGALKTVTERYDEAERRLRVALRQWWNDSIDLEMQGRYAEVVALWSPYLELPAFRPDDPRWADDEAGRCTVHGVRSLLFRACVALGQSDMEYVPLAFAALRHLVATPLFHALDEERSELDADGADTQNANYGDTLALALRWSNGWSPEVLKVFGIPKQDSEAVFAAAARRLEEVREAGTGR